MSAKNNPDNCADDVEKDANDEIGSGNYNQGRMNIEKNVENLESDYYLKKILELRSIQHDLTKVTIE